MSQVKEWKRVESEVVGEYDVFDVRRHVAKSPRTGDVHEFHVLDVPTCVLVIPLTDDGRVVMVEQYRHAVQRVTLEFPAGAMDDGEGAVEAAQRELEEETGYCAGAAELLTDFDPDPAIQSNPVKLVLARECTARGERHQDSGEDVAVRLVEIGAVGDMIRNGEIRNAAAITGWSLYERLTR
jgi:ADP-ribose pyrophosphatase